MLGALLFPQYRKGSEQSMVQFLFQPEYQTSAARADQRQAFQLWTQVDSVIQFSMAEAGSEFSASLILFALAVS